MSLLMNGGVPYSAQLWAWQAQLWAWHAKSWEFSLQKWIKWRVPGQFTKSLAGPLWPNALHMLGIFDTYEILKSSAAGLKIGENISNDPNMTLAPPGRNQAHLPGYRKRQKRKPVRVPRYMSPTEE